MSHSPCTRRVQRTTELVESPTGEFVETTPWMANLLRRVWDVEYGEPDPAPPHGIQRPAPYDQDGES